MRRRLAVGGRRSFVEDEARTPGTELERLLEGAFLLPLRQHLLLEVREADLLVYLVEHLTPREIRIDLWDEPRDPRYHPDFRGCHLGRSLGSGSGVISAPSSAARLSAGAWLSVDRSNGPNCLRLRRASLDFTGQVDSARLGPNRAGIGGYPPMLRRAAITKYATSVTNRGDRSIPDTGGTQRRTGASTGS